MAELKTILATLNLIDTKKENLRKAYDELQALSSTYSSFSPFSFTWSDLDFYLSSIQFALTRRVDELERLEAQHALAVLEQPAPTQASVDQSRTRSSISETLKRKEPPLSSDSPAQEANLLTQKLNNQPAPAQASVDRSRSSISKTLKLKEPPLSSDSLAQEVNLFTKKLNDQPSSISSREQFAKKGPSSSVNSMTQLVVETPMSTPNTKKPSSSSNSLTQLIKEVPISAGHLNEQPSSLNSLTQMVKEAPLSIQKLNAPSASLNSVNRLVKMTPLSTTSVNSGTTSSDPSLNKALGVLVQEARSLMQIYGPPSSSNTLFQKPNSANQNFGGWTSFSQNQIKPDSNEISKQVLLWPELKAFCENMDICGLRNFIFCNMSNVDLYKLRVELLTALRSAPDPALLVFGGMNWLWSSISSRRRAYKFLLEQLRALCPKKNPDVKKLAREYVVMWKDHLKKHGATAEDAYCILFLVACYCVHSSLTNDERMKFAFLAAENDEAPKLCRAVGLKKQIPDLIRKLVSEGKYIVAVKFIMEFDLAEEISPIPILRAYVDQLKRHTDKALDERSEPISSEFDAATREINALKSVIATIHNYKLEFEYPCLNLHQRIGQLTKWKIEYAEYAKLGRCREEQARQIQILKDRMAAIEEMQRRKEEKTAELAKQRDLSSKYDDYDS